MYNFLKAWAIITMLFVPCLVVHNVVLLTSANPTADPNTVMSMTVVRMPGLIIAYICSLPVLIMAYVKLVMIQLKEEIKKELAADKH